MTVKIAVIKEDAAFETRVAATPDSVKKLIQLGTNVTVENNAGLAANISDATYKDAGANIAKNRDEALKGVDIVLCVRMQSIGFKQPLPKELIVIGLSDAYKHPEAVKKCADLGLHLMGMEFVPRITRAQSMDVLSSQSNLSGYKAVLDAASYYGRAFPMMMTAAGTIPPAKVFVMGAGVAGLQAIATAKRLGAIVSATDVRPAAKEQVESLGGKFVAVENDEFREAETAGGYAKEMSKDYQKQQADLVKETIAKQDIVITTALIPGRPAPVLVTSDMVKSMKPGSVIVDLAVENGGNCELSEADKIVEKHGVTIIAFKNTAGRLATDASMLYAKNILNLVTMMIDKDSKELSINHDDEIIQGITLTKGGKITHPALLQSAPKIPAAKKTATKKAATKKPATRAKAPAKKTEKPSQKKDASS